MWWQQFFFFFLTFALFSLFLFSPPVNFLLLRCLGQVAFVHGPYFMFCFFFSVHLIISSRFVEVGGVSGESKCTWKKISLRKCALAFVLSTHKEVEADRGRHKRRRKILKISRILRRINRNEKGKTTTKLQNYRTTRRQKLETKKNDSTFFLFSFGYEGWDLWISRFKLAHTHPSIQWKKTSRGGLMMIHLKIELRLKLEKTNNLLILTNFGM